MQQLQHTPGPWEIVDRWPPNGCGAQIWGSGVHIASLTRALDKPPVQKFADAQLIAAAPALLSIAKRWAAIDGGSWHPERHAREKAELLADTLAAIAQAEAVQ